MTPPARPTALPMWLWPLLVVALLAVVAVGAALLSEDETLWVPKTNVEAGHRITEHDLIEKELDAEAGALAAKSEIVGRVAIKPLSEGKPISEKDVTTRVGDRYDTHFTTRLTFRTRNAASDDIEPGARVELIFVPTARARHEDAYTIDAVLVNATEAGGDSVYFVAINGEDRAPLLARVARFRLLVHAR